MKKKRTSRVRQPTVDDWLALLPIVATRKWHEEPRPSSPYTLRRIRCRRGDCPLVAIVKEIDPSFRGGSGDFEQGIEELGLSGTSRAVSTIADAADLDEEAIRLASVRRTRARLKAALGIKGA